jgi:SAM-dependent methyltransferase
MRGFTALLERLRQERSRRPNKAIANYVPPSAEDTIVSEERFVPEFQPNVAWARSHWARYEFALNYVTDNESVLDIACGAGYGTNMLLQKAKGVVGVDHSANTIAYAKEQYRGDFRVGDFFDHIGKFDLIISFETLEHIAQPLTVSLSHLCRASTKMVIGSVPYQEKQGNNPFHAHFDLSERHLLFLETFGDLQIWYQEKEPGFGIFRKLDSHRVQNMVFIITLHQES